MPIVTTTYRYKPPPKRKRRKLAEITGSAIVTSVPVKKSRRTVRDHAAAEAMSETARLERAGDIQPSTLPERERDPVVTTAGKAPQPANDDGPRKSAIVTARKPGSRRSDVPDMTPEEHQRRGDAADALWRELVRRVRDGG